MTEAQGMNILSDKPALTFDAEFYSDCIYSSVPTAFDLLCLGNILD